MCKWTHFPQNTTDGYAQYRYDEKQTVSHLVEFLQTVLIH
jgi:hypothetical protein